MRGRMVNQTRYVKGRRPNPPRIADGDAHPARSRREPSDRTAVWHPRPSQSPPNGIKQTVRFVRGMRLSSLKEAL